MPFFDINKIFKTFCLLPIVVFCFLSCDEVIESENSGKTTFLFFPWTNNLTDYFYKNISELEETIISEGLKGGRVVVFISTSETEAQMFEIVSKRGKCKHKVLKEYDNPNLNTVDGLNRIFNDMKLSVPGETYSMIIGAHGTGWLPVVKSKVRRAAGFKYHFECDSMPMTRYYGGLSPEYQTEINTLAAALADSRLMMEYILFDCCYMSSMEAVYQLRNVAKYIIASPTEIMAVGMPYRKMGKYLLAKKCDYQTVCNIYYRFYSDYWSPYGTLAVIDCRELDAMAEVMKLINVQCRFDPADEPLLQRMDGYFPPIFYDFGDYVKHLCQDDRLLYEIFEKQLYKTVPYKVNTEYYYSAQSGKMPINSFSGITISEPSINPMAQEVVNTEWYRDSH